MNSDPLVVVSPSPKATAAIGEAVGSVIQEGDAVLLSGTLGAGKTVFTQGLAVGLGVAEPVTSPTFVLVRPYRGRVVMHHADLWRLETRDEISALDLEEVIDLGGAVAVIEWGERAAEMFPGALEVSLEVVEAPGAATGDESATARTIQMRSSSPSWWGRLGQLRPTLANLAAGNES